LIHELLAEEYPNDPLAITMFARDTNFSGYSYARFHEYPGTGELIDESDPAQVDWMLDNLWATDINNLLITYGMYGNLHYYIPYFRDVNESHCVAIIEFTGTEIQAEGVDAGNFINDVLNGNPVTSYEEGENPADYNVTGFWIDLVNLLL